MAVLVTGANRGIGLEWIRQLVKSTSPLKYVFATYRSKDAATVLEEVKESSSKCHVIPVQMDITKKEDIRSLRETIEGCVGADGLNLLINNAGAFRMGSFETLSEDDMMFHFNTNTVGPILMLKELFPLLQRATHSEKRILNLSKATVLNISSFSASIGNLTDVPKELLDPLVAYRTSKAALNMAMRTIALASKNKNVLIVNMCPGWVKTDMGSSGADIDPAESVTTMLKTLPTLDMARLGDFMDRHGKAIPF